VGNVRQTPVGELLRDKKMFKIQQQLMYELPGGRCARCSMLDWCNGGCPGRALAASGSVRAEEPACLWRLHRPSRARR
jgi:radical SAM protein with 4Fe4S-binding SPASM domain